jgi:Ca2+-binding EF-hand superfamily protein
VNYIFQKYDTNKDNLLDRGEVKHLLTASLKHLGTNHAPTDLEVIEFIYSMDKNSDGKLSRE